MPGPLELLVIAALALIVFGPKRLPEMARSIGKAVNEFRRQASDLKSEFDLSMDEDEAEEMTRAAHATPPKSSLDPDPDPAMASGEPVEEMDPDPTVPAAETDPPDKS